MTPEQRARLVSAGYDATAIDDAAVVLARTPTAKRDEWIAYLVTLATAMAEMEAQRAADAARLARLQQDPIFRITEKRGWTFFGNFDEPQEARI